MMRGRSARVFALVAAGLLFAPRPSSADDEDPLMSAWAAFAEERSGECIGPPGKLSRPIPIEAGRHRYRLDGHRLVQLSTDQDDVLRVGVLSAIKDERDATMAAVKRVIARLKKRRIELLVVNGDIAEASVNADEIIFPTLAESGVLTVVHVGNTETCGWFNQSATRAFRRHRNLINGNWVRQLELDDGVLYTLPGYHDRRFTHTAGAAIYKPDDVEQLGKLLKTGPGPKVLVAHGPPRMKGKRGIDIATDAGHVGDPAVTQLIKVHRIRFGLFGHILEAGGRASDLAGQRRRKPNRWYPNLYVNAGTVNPDPWPMLDGKTSYGMGLYVEIKDKKARYSVIRLSEQPAGDD